MLLRLGADLITADFQSTIANPILERAARLYTVRDRAINPTVFALYRGLTHRPIRNQLTNLVIAFWILMVKSPVKLSPVKFPTAGRVGF